LEIITRRDSICTKISFFFIESIKYTYIQNFNIEKLYINDKN